MLITPARKFYSEMYKRMVAAGSAPFYRHYDETYNYIDAVRIIRSINASLSGKRHRGVVVAVYADKCFPAYAAIYASIFSGNIWLPINPEIPPSRVAAMFELAQPTVVLTDRPMPLELQNSVDHLDATVIDLFEAASQPGIDFDFQEIDDQDVAYIMFTSGSTGVPKGVPMTHANYISFIDNAMEILPLENGDVFSDYHDFGFDISVFYLFCCPLVGGCFAPGVIERDRLMPIAHLKKHGVTILASVPSIISRIRLIQRNGPLESSVRVLFLCGEPFRLDILKYCFESIRPQCVHNFYGLTETGVENFTHRCSEKDLEEFAEIGFVPIGQPLPRNLIHLTDEGELMLAGPQLTPGYLGGVESERFQSIDGVLWYRTNDRVIQYKGQFFCKGRLDSQVKLNGYRIELMDIEAHLRRLDGIEEAVCFVHSVGDRSYIVAIVQAPGGIDTTGVQSNLLKSLPAYMVPRAVELVSELPLNKSGKVDRAGIQKDYLQNL